MCDTAQEVAKNRALIALSHTMVAAAQVSASAPAAARPAVEGAAEPPPLPPFRKTAKADKKAPLDRMPLKERVLQEKGE